MDPNLSGIVAYAGDNKDVLLKKMYIALQLEADGITVIPGLKGKMSLHKLRVSKGVKPGTGIFKPNDSFNFENRILQVEKAQRDLQIMPQKYLQTWMEHKRGAGENPSNMTIPFADVMWSSVMEEVAEEIATQTIFHGQGKAAFTAYDNAVAYPVGALKTYTQGGETRYFECIVATNAGENPDTYGPDTATQKWEWAGAKALCKGYSKLIDEEEVLGTIVPVSTGEITSLDGYDQFTMVWRKQTDVIKKGGAFLYCSQSSLESLFDSYEEKVSKHFETVDGITYLAKTDKKCIVKPVSWLAGSGKLICTPPGQFWLGTDQASDMNTMKTIEQMYHLDLGMSFMIGLNFSDPTVMVVNDQD